MEQKRPVDLFSTTLNNDPRLLTGDGEIRVYPEGITVAQIIEQATDIYIGGKHMPMSAQDMAANLGGMGLPVFPIKEGSKAPACRNGWKDSTTDAGQIAKWWPNNQPNRYGIGVVPGAWGCLVVDLDVPKDGEVDGREWWAERYGTPTLHPHIATTPSGGLHLWYKAPRQYIGPRNRPITQDGKKVSLDIRCDAGYVVWKGVGPDLHYNHYWDPVRLLPTPLPLLVATTDLPAETLQMKSNIALPPAEASQPAPSKLPRIDTDKIKKACTIDMLAMEFGGTTGNLMVSCPDPTHPDANPSAQLHVDKEGTAVWYCFKCQIGGDIIQFYMVRDSLDFVDAAKKAQERLGLNV